MPIQKPIESVVNQLSEKPQFIFASAAELNDMLDQTKRFPVVGLVAETAINLSYGLSHSVHNEVPVFLYFLYKAEHNRDRTADQEILVQRALGLCKEFMLKLSQQRGDNKGRIFRIKAGQQVEFKTIYHLNTFDTLTAGGYITLNLQTMYHETL